MDTGSALGGTGLFISLLGIIYSAVNHKHLKARCCGKDLDFSIDIDSTDSDPKVKAQAQTQAPAQAQTQAPAPVQPQPPANANGVGLTGSDKISSIGFKPHVFKVHPLFEN
jgi:hypothetical protein